MKVPIRSYYKTTLALLYDNEGEVNWSVAKLMKEIKSNEECLKKLTNTGYKSKSKHFTAEQVEIIFNHIGTPQLNTVNRKLLKIKSSSTLDYLETKWEKLKLDEMEEISKLPDAALSDIGMRRHSGDCNDHYVFKDNEDYYFIKNNEGYFILRQRSTFKALETIKSTPRLVAVLLRLRNEGY
jgi:hypothetical protein